MNNENKMQLLYTMYCLSCTGERIANGEKLTTEEYLSDLTDFESLINQRGILDELGQDTAFTHEGNPAKSGQR